VLATGGFEGMLDKLREAFPFHHRPQLHPNVDAPGEGRIGRSIQRVCQAGVAH
jgi:hypothetical protein